MILEMQQIGNIVINFKLIGAGGCFVLDCVDNFITHTHTNTMIYFLTRTRE